MRQDVPVPWGVWVGVGILLAVVTAFLIYVHHDVKKGNQGVKDWKVTFFNRPKDDVFANIVKNRDSLNEKDEKRLWDQAHIDFLIDYIKELKEDKG